MNKIYPKVSIITPAYNQGRFLEETILSVLNQKYPNLEYIIIDGGSTDNSVEIIKKYEKHLTYWVSEQDKGQSVAINKGLKMATGEILAYCNSDDCYLPSCLNTVVQYFQEHPNTDLIYGNAYFINEHGKLIGIKKELPFDYKMACCIGFGRIVFDPSTFWRRSVLDKVDYIDENLHYIMDGDYFFRAAQCCKIEHVNDFLVAMRRHSQAKSSEHSLSNQLFAKEYYHELKRAFQTLPISKYMSFSKFNQLRRLYHVKRIFQRFFKGHYFLALISKFQDIHIHPQK